MNLTKNPIRGASPKEKLAISDMPPAFQLRFQLSFIDKPVPQNKIFILQN